MSGLIQSFDVYSLGKSIRSKSKLNISNCVHSVYTVTQDVQANVTSNVFTQTVTSCSLQAWYEPYFEDTYP